MLSMFRVAAISLTLTMALSGCLRSQYDLAGQVGLYNSAIERLEEQAILINILRASDNAPMGFTQLAVVRGSGSNTTSIAIPGINLGPPAAVGAKNTVIGSGSVSLSPNTNFDLAVLDTKEFWQGVLTPLSPKTLVFFINQGVPREILFNLYVARTELSTSGKAPVIEVNNPLDPTYGGFASDLQQSLALGLTADTATRSFNFGPPIPAKRAENIENLLDVAKSGMSIVPVASKNGSEYQLKVSASAAVICFNQANASLDIADRVPTAATCAAMRGESAPAGESAGPFLYEQSATGTHPPVTIQIYPRSTYDIFRYLGALVRTSLDKGTYVNLTTDQAKIFGGGGALADKLFVVQKNAPGDSYVSVTYNGDTYSVPKSATTTIQVLALLRQLVALSTSVNSLPSSGTVTTVVP